MTQVELVGPTKQQSPAEQSEAPLQGTGGRTKKALSP
jgi:hypothetical protein